MQTSRIALSATLVGFGFSACVCEEPLGQLAPKIEIGDPYDPTFSVCDEDFIRDCRYSFGDVTIGDPKHFSFVIKNPSPVDLQIFGITFQEGSAPQFTLAGDVPSVIENEIGGTGKIVDVKFDPAVEGPQTAVLAIDSDAENLTADELVLIELDANGLDRGQPDIVVTPAQCDFGAVGVGQVAYCDLSVENVGVRELLISGVDWTAGTPTPDVFGAESALIIPTFIQPGTATSVRLYARPNTTDLIEGGLILVSNDPDEPEVTVPLSVEGAQAPTAVARVKSINGIPNNDAAPAVEPLDNVVISGDQSTPGNPGASITSYQWTLLSQPPESSVTLTAPNQADTGFVFSSATGNVQGLDVAGTFVVALVVTDSTGAVSTNTCEIVMNAVPTEGIHVQLSWSAAVNDIDLHLGRNASPDWCSLDDCYYGNCQSASPPNWDGAGGFTDGDPKLDIDDLSGFGPENINIESPVAGTYVIGVHAFSGNGSGSGFTPTDLTVKVFLGGALAQEFFGHFENDDDFWTVARIDVAASGQSSVTGIESMTSSWSCF